MNTEQPNQKETQPRELETILVDPEKSLALRLFLQSRPGTEEHADFWTQAIDAGLRKPLDGIGIPPEILASFLEAQAVKPAPAPTSPEQGTASAPSLFASHSGSIFLILLFLAFFEGHR